VGEYYRAEEATDDKMVHAHCTVDTEGYKYTLRLLFHCNNGCTSAPQYYVIRTLPTLSPLVDKLTLVLLVVSRDEK
jgi:hypothetical protein